MDFLSHVTSVINFDSFVGAKITVLTAWINQVDDTSWTTACAWTVQMLKKSIQWRMEALNICTDARHSITKLFLFILCQYINTFTPGNKCLRFYYAIYNNYVTKYIFHISTIWSQVPNKVKISKHNLGYKTSSRIGLANTISHFVSFCDLYSYLHVTVLWYVHGACNYGIKELNP